ncbi:MAG: hypothetical protein J5J06_18515 [Phycisphaerae bacterium]|nr:hypothetical protein [Phycisphaerae bacterium]
MSPTFDLLGLVSILAIPLQIVYHVVWGLGDFLVFNVLHLGPYLPIPTPFA